MICITRILAVNPVNPEMGIIREAAAIIKNGGTVVFPTETVYGIGANAFDGTACTRIFEAKGRPSDNPLIVHISDLEQLNGVAEGADEKFLDVAKILWPGPITFILKKGIRMPDQVTAGLGTVAVRMPAHPVALRLIEESGTPIAAPSANTSQKPSATKAAHVINDLGGKVDMILDGGSTAFGLESTIINMTVAPPALLRPGAFTIEELEKFLGRIAIPEGLNTIASDGTPIAPGMKYRHYAPDKRILAIRGNDLLVEAADIASKEKKIAVICSDEMSARINGNAKIIKLGSEASLYGITKNLFDSFRRVDSMGVELALVQVFPERGIGLALMNRIIKASGSEPIDTIEELKRLL